VRAGRDEQRRVRPVLTLDRIAAVAGIPDKRVVISPKQPKIVAATASNRIVAVAPERMSALSPPTIVSLPAPPSIVSTVSVARPLPAEIASSPSLPFTSTFSVVARTPENTTSGAAAAICSDDEDEEESGRGVAHELAQSGRRAAERQTRATASPPGDNRAEEEHELGDREARPRAAWKRDSQGASSPRRAAPPRRPCSPARHRSREAISLSLNNRGAHVTRDFPWGRPRHELALLALVAVATLTPVYGINAQDVSRLCLTRALVHAHLADDKCFEGQIDKASYGGHLFSDKAPGMSVLEIPTAEALRLQPIEHVDRPGGRLWGVRILSSGIAFLLCALLVGRVAEGLAAGCGGAALVAFALGTLIAGLAAANFGHVTAAALAFGAFLLAWRRRPLPAGLLAGAAVLVEYQATVVLAIVGVYVALRGWRPLAAYVAGAVPGIALLLAYDQLAFGAPWHLSYKYVANSYVLEQEKGFFGVGVPRLFSSYEVFSGTEGLLVVSPVVVAALWGLALLSRRYPAEAVVCAAVVAFFVVANCGYFLPYGGVSPGPRFLVPALPFLAVGLGPVFAWRPRLTALLALLSVVATTALTLVWGANLPLHRTIWGELAHTLAAGRDARFARSLTPNALEWVGVGRIGCAMIVFAAAAAALALALRTTFSLRATAPRRAALAVAASLCLVGVATASALAEYPYSGRVASVPAVISTAIDASTAAALSGGEVDFVLTVVNPTNQLVSGVTLNVELPPAMQLLGRPFYERGSGCVGTSEISCDLDFLLEKMSTIVRLGVRLAPTARGTATVTAWTSVNGTPGRRVAVEVTVGS